jgi:hypothetical protein
MNSVRNQQVSKKLKKGEIIQTRTFKKKVKCYFMKCDDYILEGGK